MAAMAMSLTKNNVGHHQAVKVARVVKVVHHLVAKAASAVRAVLAVRA